MADEKFVQGGARVKLEGKNFTKTLLKARIKEDPSKVMLFSTSNMGPTFTDSADKLPVGVKFLVVGPNPYSKRDWYATVKVGRNGKLVVT